MDDWSVITALQQLRNLLKVLVGKQPLTHSARRIMYVTLRENNGKAYRKICG
jgi:hypothetical protein